MDEQKHKRKHRRTGRPVGGKRVGAGRPPGIRAPLGIRPARLALKLRILEGTPGPQAELAEEAFDRIVAVMRGQVEFDLASTTLKAATHVRAEICGPLPQKLEHAGRDGGAISIEIIRTVSEPTPAERREDYAVGATLAPEPEPGGA